MGFISDLFGAQNNYNAASPNNTSNSQFNPALQAQLNKVGDTAQYQQSLAQQQALANALRDQSRGGGVTNQLSNAQLQQATNQNIKNASGVIAGTKGINPGLAARLAGQNAASAGQEAANQSAINKANIALNSQNQLGNVLNTQAGQALQQQGLTNQAVGTLGGLTGQQNAINAGIAGQNANTNANVAGGILGGLTGAAQSAFAQGGEVDQLPIGAQIGFPGVSKQKPKMMAEGGDADATTIDAAPMSANGDWANYMGAPLDSSPLAQAKKPQSAPGNMFGGVRAFLVAPGVPDFTNAGPGIGGGLSGAMGKGGGGLAKALMVAKGGSIHNMKTGGHVPGQAPVEGDSYANDNVHALLSPKEIVLPRSVTLAEDAPEKAKAFVEAIQRKEGQKSEAKDSSAKGYAHVLAKHRELHERLSKVEQALKGR